MQTTIADIELEVTDRGLAHMPTDEIVLLLVEEALTHWKRDLFAINEALWEETMDDRMGDERKKQNVELTGDYIAAVHQWAKGGQK